jgi:dephospho-CoA kinase
LTLLIGGFDKMIIMRLVGIAGLPRSGKDTVAEIFIEDGWFGMSFGDVVRNTSKERHKDSSDPISVANMTETANWLRQNHGPDVILKEALKQFKAQQKQGKNYKGLVLYSVRAPIEADFILSKNGQLIWVEASDEVRYKRAMDNLRQGEQEITLAEFKKQETLQWQPQPDIPKEIQMDISYVKSHVTKVIENNGDNLEEFQQQIKKIISSV